MKLKIKKMFATLKKNPKKEVFSEKELLENITNVLYTKSEIGETVITLMRAPLRKKITKNKDRLNNSNKLQVALIVLFKKISADDNLNIVINNIETFIKCNNKVRKKILESNSITIELLYVSSDLYSPIMLDFSGSLRHAYEDFKIRSRDSSEEVIEKHKEIDNIIKEHEKELECAFKKSIQLHVDKYSNKPEIDTDISKVLSSFFEDVDFIELTTILIKTIPYVITKHNSNEKGSKNERSKLKFRELYKKYLDQEIDLKCLKTKLEETYEEINLLGMGNPMNCLDLHNHSTTAKFKIRKNKPSRRR